MLIGQTSDMRISHWAFGWIDWHILLNLLEWSIGVTYFFVDELRIIPRVKAKVHFIQKEVTPTEPVLFFVFYLNMKTVDKKSHEVDCEDADKSRTPQWHETQSFTTRAKQNLISAVL